MARAPDKNSDIRNCIAEIVKQQTAKVEIAPAADQRQRNPAVDGQRQQRDADHPALMDGDRVAEAFERLIEKTQRDQDQQDRVGECGQNPGALVTDRCAHDPPDARPSAAPIQEISMVGMSERLWSASLTREMEWPR